MRINFKNLDNLTDKEILTFFEIGFIVLGSNSPLIGNGIYELIRGKEVIFCVEVGKPKTESIASIAVQRNNPMFLQITSGNMKFNQLKVINLMRVWRILE